MYEKPGSRHADEHSLQLVGLADLPMAASQQPAGGQQTAEYMLLRPDFMPDAMISCEIMCFWVTKILTLYLVGCSDSAASNA